MATDYASLAKQFPANSAMYNLYMGIAQNPQNLNNPSVQGEIQSNANIAPSYNASGMGSPVTGTTNGALGSNQPDLNQPPPAGTPQLPGPGSATGAPGNGPDQPVTLPGPTGTPLQPVASPSQPGGDVTQPVGNSAPASMMSRPASSPGGAQPADMTGGLPINIGSLGLGSLNMGALLPALFSSGLGLWNMLGSKGAYTDAGNVVNNAEVGAGNQVNTAAEGAASGVTGAAQTGNSLLNQMLSYFNGQTKPYQDAGGTAAAGLNSGLAPGGNLNTNLTADQVLANDPGYQFRLGQGLQGVQGKLAAEGLGDSGEALKQLTQYGQDYASQQYQQAFQNQQTQQQNLFQRLYGTSGLGETGVGQAITSGEAFGTPQATNDINAANSAGGFNVAGSEYQGNANATGAGAVAGGKILSNQAQQNFIQQLMAMIPALMNQGQNGGSGLPNILGPVFNYPQPGQASPGY